MKYGYIRVSTKGQARNGNSLEDQRRSLIEAGIDAENIYHDSFTGTKMNRTGFDELMGKLQSGDELVVTKLDRFARTAAEGSLLVRKLVDDGTYSLFTGEGSAWTPAPPSKLPKIRAKTKRINFERKVLANASLSYIMVSEPNTKEDRIWMQDM